MKALGRPGWGGAVADCTGSPGRMHVPGHLPQGRSKVTGRAKIPPTPTLPRKGGGSQKMPPRPLLWPPPPLWGRVGVGGRWARNGPLYDPAIRPAFPTAGEKRTQDRPDRCGAVKTNPTTAAVLLGPPGRTNPPAVFSAAREKRSQPASRRRMRPGGARPTAGPNASIGRSGRARSVLGKTKPGSAIARSWCRLRGWREASP